MAAIFALTVVAHSQAYPQYPGRGQERQGEERQKDETPRASDAERQAALKVVSTPDLPGKFKAAGEFIKKYPKSKLRGEVATTVAAKIAEIQDASERITQFEAFLAIFKEDSDVAIVTPALIDSYLKAQRNDDAFRVASSWLEKNPGDVASQTQMAIVGTELLKQGNNKFVQQSQQFGAKAIELIESDKKGNLTDVQWSEYKTKWLAQLYQSMGILALGTSNLPEAKAKLEKAIAINEDDPLNHALVGQIVDNEYQELAQKYKTMAPGPSQEETLKQALARMDQVIEMFARAIALSEGKEHYKKLHDSLMQGLESYYKYRHNGSTEGLRKVIDKYKKTVAPGQ